MPFVDTNIFIRHLNQDDPKKARACFKLFQKAQRAEISLFTTEAVVTEMVYILSSKQLYNRPRDEIRRLLYPLLSLSGIKLTHKRTHLRALDLYAMLSIDYEDALIAAHMERQGITKIYSYDLDFDRIKDVSRLEP